MREKQINESKGLILNGFFILLEKKPYQKITMSEIADASMVTRMTLYRHFKNKEEIIEFFFYQMAQTIKKEFDQSENKSMDTLLLIRNKVISQNGNLRIAIKNTSAESIIRDVISKNRILFLEFIKQYSNNNIYRKQFLSGGVEAVTVNWILNGMKETPEKITKEIMDIFSFYSRNDKEVIR